jgi:hypothetical protein
MCWKNVPISLRSRARQRRRGDLHRSRHRPRPGARPNPYPYQDVDILIWKRLRERVSQKRPFSVNIPVAVTPVGTNGPSLPNMICEVGTRFINAAIADRLAELAIS